MSEFPLADWRELLEPSVAGWGHQHSQVLHVFDDFNGDRLLVEIGVAGERRELFSRQELETGAYRELLGSRLASLTAG